MTNNQSNRNGGGRQNSHVNQGTPSPTSESTEEAVSVEDIKDAVFTFVKKMLDTYIVSSEKFLMYAGSKFGPSEQLSLDGGHIIVHNAVKACCNWEPEEVRRNEFHGKEDMGTSIEFMEHQEG